MPAAPIIEIHVCEFKDAQGDRLAKPMFVAKIWNHNRQRLRYVRNQMDSHHHVQMQIARFGGAYLMGSDICHTRRVDILPKD